MKLIIPVYLNQKLVFDLIAMMRDGMSTITKVSVQGTELNSSTGEISGGFGLGSALSSLLKMDMSIKDSSKNQSEQNETKSEERVHTPASILFNLLRDMKSGKIITPITNENSPKIGDFVEFDAVLTRNPMVETIDAFSELMKVATTLTEDPEMSNNQRKKAKAENDQIIQKMDDFGKLLKAGNTIDLVAKDVNSSLSALVTVETAFLNDPLMSDLVEGQFKILGKVIKVVKKGETPISFLRKSALSKMPDEILNEVFDAFSTLKSEQGFALPDNKYALDGPAFQVIPIAIYA